MPLTLRPDAIEADAVADVDAARSWERVGMLAEALASPVDRLAFARAVVGHGRHALHASAGLVAIIEPGRDALRSLASQGYSRAQERAYASVPLAAAAPIATAARTGQAVLLGDAADVQAGWPGGGPLRPVFGAVACVPFGTGERVTGALELRWSSPIAFGHTERMLLDAIAALAAQAFDRVRLDAAEGRSRREAKEAQRRSDTLAAVAGMFAVARDEEDVLDTLVRSGLPLAGATSVAVLSLADSGALVPVRMVGYPVDAVAAPIDRLPVADAIRRGQPVVLPNRETIVRRYPEMGEVAARIDARTIVALPLVAHGQRIGGIRLGFPDNDAVTPAMLRYLGTLADTTAQAYERARLHAVQHRWLATLEAVIRQLPVGVAVAEAPSGHLVLVNDQLGSVWGTSVHPGTSGAAEQEAWSGFHLDGRPYRPDDWPLTRSVRRGETVSDERIEVSRSDGTRGVMSVSSGPVRDQDGRIILGAAVVADVTERVRTERLRDAFIGVLSHELRTPITAIYGGSMVLLRPEGHLDAAARRGLLEDMAAEAERMHRLVENLLVLARTERGVDLHAADPVLLQHVVPRVVASIRGQWPEVEFNIGLAQRLPTVSGDDAYVEQVLRNLLSNAAKYGPPGGPVSVAVEHVGDEVRVSVRDHGPGVAGEAVEVFDLFYRSARTAASAPGAGIGLFVARQLVLAMGGRIWARDRPEGGATFGFSLPLFDLDA